jgi:anti-sigma regulatory factor (Ser/Thr protein kinase)
MLTDSVEVDFDPDSETFREELAAALRRQALPAAKMLDLLLASTEIVTNALTHGGGVKAARVGRVGGRHAVEVVDHGLGFDDPTAGYLAPRAGQGAGLWVARQLMWDVDFFRAPDGFTTRITA